MRLSVAMCTYNGAQYVEEQLRSILEQELPVDEIVVCDDGSKDETLTIVRRIAAAHSEIKWNIQQNSPNLGVTKNFEKAITLCTGDIIFLSDQDDIWRKDKTRVIMDYFKEHPDKSVVFTDAALVDGEGHSLTNYTMLDYVGLKPNYGLWKAGLDVEMLNLNNIATGATMAIKKESLGLFLPFFVDKDCLHDYQIIVSACLNGVGGIYMKPLISYRQHGNNDVGCKTTNWIFSGETPPDYLWITEPNPLQKWIANYKCSRISFYESRLKYYSTLKGKILLCCLILKYKKYYHSCWVEMMLLDLLYGVNKSLRNWIVCKLKSKVS